MTRRRIEIRRKRKKNIHSGSILIALVVRKLTLGMYFLKQSWLLLLATRSQIKKRRYIMHTDGSCGMAAALEKLRLKPQATFW